MAVDILGLGYKVDTGDIKRAERDLDRFSGANKRATENIDDLGKQSERTSRTTSDLARSLGTLAGAFVTLQAATSLVRIADEYTKFTAQLKLATESVAQFQAAYSDVVDIARSSQAEIGGLGTLYARITNATREMGLAQSDVAKISETVALSLRVSGASAAESESAMLQLSQAFGSGVLRGEEFNALNEAAPGLLRALAESIGVPVGALREMASNGELTADVLALAFKDDELLAKLREQSKEVQTVSSAMTALSNELTIAIGELDTATGASASLAGAIQSIARAIAGFKDVYPSIEPFLAGGVVVGGFIALNAILNTLVATTIPRLLIALPAIYTAMLPIVATLGPIVAGFTAFAAAVGFSTKAAKEAQEPTVILNKLFERQAALQKQIAENGADFVGFTGGKNLGQQLAEVQANIANVGGKLLESAGASEQFAKAQESVATATKKASVETPKLTKAVRDLDSARNAAARETDRAISDEARNTEAIQRQVQAIREQIAQYGKSAVQQRQLERENLDFAESVILMRKSMAEAGMASRDLIPEYEAQLQAIRDLRAEQDRLFDLQDTDKYRQAAEALESANRKVADTFKDDLLDSIKTAFLQGGKFGDSFVRGLKAELIEMFLDPALTAAINGAKSGNFSSLANIAAGASVAGGAGASLGALLSNANSIAARLVDITGATGNTAASMLQLGNSLGKIAPFAGSIAALVQGDVRGAAGSALGTFIGNTILPGIGGAIGAALGGMLGGSGKISATSLGPEFGQNVTKALADQYAATAAALGGAAASIVFGAGGNTGRQGQNPNFTLSAFSTGRQIFNSSQTREGQADGLFLSGEIALNEANLADQSLRALFTALQETDFADNIDAVVRGVNALSASADELNAALTDAQLLATINGFKDMEGALRTLSGASAETAGKFFSLVGGVEGLNAGMSAFFDAFYSEQEKTELLTRDVTKAFADLGKTMPRSRQELRALTDSLDLRTDADQRLYATILQLTPALDRLLPAFDDLASIQRELSASMLQTSSSLRETIRQIQFGDMTQVAQLSDLQTRFQNEFSKALGSDGQALLQSAQNIDALVSQVLQSASDIYASGPEYQRIRELVLTQAATVADRLEQLAPMTYQEETVSLLQQISASSAITAQALSGQPVPVSAPAPSASASAVTTGQGNNAVVAELRALRQELAETGEINIKVVTESGQVVATETLRQIRERSRRGELVIYASGVKQ